VLWFYADNGHHLQPRHHSARVGSYFHFNRFGKTRNPRTSEESTSYSIPALAFNHRLQNNRAGNPSARRRADIPALTC
jgi:hypothetical protein